MFKNSLVSLKITDANSITTLLSKCGWLNSDTESWISPPEVVPSLPASVFLMGIKQRGDLEVDMAFTRTCMQGLDTVFGILAVHIKRNKLKEKKSRSMQSLYTLAKNL